jgi:hypothetical protein
MGGDFDLTHTEQLVLDELLRIRKSRGGIAVEAVAQSPTICQLLGNGDPYVAYSRLRQRALEADTDLDIQAAIASLGFSTHGTTHLHRLDEFGLEVNLDQRQVRRHSDKGLRVLARAIASNWTVESVPELTALIVEGEPASFELHVATRCPLVTTMSTPRIELVRGKTREIVEAGFVDSEDGLWINGHTIEPVRFASGHDETAVSIVWRGELWPKWNVQVRMLNAAVVGVEAVGNRVTVRQ